MSKVSQLVSRESQLKLTAADGKKYATDTFDYMEGIGEWTSAIRGI